MMDSLLTERLALRPFRQGDAAALFAAFDRDRAYLERWGGRIAATEAEVAAHIDAWATARERGQAFFYAVLLRGQLIGGVQIVVAESGAGDASSWIAEAHAGRGYATEALAALAYAAFLHRHVTRLEVACLAGNVAGLRVAEAIGFSLSTTDDRLVTGVLDERSLVGTPAGAGAVRLLSLQALWAAIESRFGAEVPVGLTPIVAAGEASVLLTARFAPIGSLSALELLHHNATLAVGAICILDGQYALRHVLPLATLDLRQALRAVELMEHEARRLAPAAAAAPMFGGVACFDSFAD